MIMKTTKRFIAMAAALTLTACTAIPMASFAAQTAEGSGNSITVTSSDTDTHTYAAYQVFSGTMSDDVLTNIDWGDGVNGPAILTALKAASADNASPLKGLFPSTIGDAKGVAEVLGSKSGDPAEAVFGNDSDKAKAFADIVGKNLTTTTSGSASGNTISRLPDGYYLVQDSAKPTGDNPGAKTRFILCVTDNATIDVNAKSSVPSVEKKVLENVKDVTGKPINDSTTTDKWNDVADYNIGDAVPFKLYGTLPSTYADYEHYYYKFTDTLADGFVAPAAGDIKVKVNGTEVNDTAKNMRIVVSGQTITVSFEDIKEFAKNASDIITVEYSAVLDTDAAIGLNGNENKVKLEFSNNPNLEYNPTTTDDKEDKPKDDNGTPDDTTDDYDGTDETPEDKVIVFTYTLEINKTDSSNTKLANAKFCVKATTGEHAGKWVKVTDGKVSGWLDAEPAANGTDGVFTSSASTPISIAGLDDGTYEITELAPPSGYNALTSPLTWVIEATTVNNQTWGGTAASDALTAIDLKENATSINQLEDDGKHGKVQGKIVNTKGSSLPTTGGIGTTLFILGGGCAAGIAGIYLVSKKKTREEE